jgi:uncharacterized membrane protein
MSYQVLSGHKVVAMVAAVAATLALQGGMLASFDHVADTSQLQASCKASTLPVVEIVHARG